MKRNKKSTVIIGILALVILGTAATRPPAPQYKNLKVLPKNITHEEMDKVMDEWKTALGVRCNFCHAPQKDNPRRMDFASDAKPEKNMARSMFRMTGRINKKFFHYKKTAENPVPPVTCMTCHNGKKHPKPAEKYTAAKEAKQGR